MIKLIVSDIDGTLLNPDHEVSDKTKEIVHKAKDQGVEFMIATGRDYDSAKGVAEKVGVDCAIISLNGMRVDCDSHNYHVREASMTFEECRRMETIGNAYFMCVLYCFEDVIYYHMDDLAFKDFELGVSEDRMKFFNDKLSTEEIQGLDDIKGRFENGSTILKMVFMQNPDYTELVKNRIRTEITEAFDLLIVSPGWSEIMPKAINKGDALLKYAAHRGIKPEEIVSFGDSDNDLTLIDRAGTGVAMGNARDSLKSIADVITLSNAEDGVAYYVEQNILK